MARAVRLADLPVGHSVAAVLAEDLTRVWPGDTLTSTLTVVASSPADDLWLVEVIVRTVNQDGVQVFTGTATAAQQVPPATS